MDAAPGPWDHDVHAELPDLNGELFAIAPRQLPRTSERLPVEMGAGLRQRGATGVSVRILDLSTTGFRVATHLELAKGTDVWLRMPKLESCHAKVVWAKGHFAGCRFERPLHPAVVAMIVGSTQFG